MKPTRPDELIWPDLSPHDVSEDDGQQRYRPECN
jgi:hypothetical protein